jgi:hypothetical protein
MMTMLLVGWDVEDEMSELKVELETTVLTHISFNLPQSKQARVL